jgi:hypothetical protein
VRLLLANIEINIHVFEHLPKCAGPLVLARFSHVLKITPESFVSDGFLSGCMPST